MNDNPSPVFLIAFCAFVMLTAPLWIPLAMCVSLATGKSLEKLNEEANAL